MADSSVSSAVVSLVPFMVSDTETPWVRAWAGVTAAATSAVHTRKAAKKPATKRVRGLPGVLSQ